MKGIGTLDFDNYIQVMAQNCYQVYEEMTQKTALGIGIDQVKPPFAAAGYRTAIVIPYENKENQIEGSFVLGFNDETMAVTLASDIAENMGMPTIDRMDGAATDILFEFMNTVAGKVITEWDKMGLDADFSPPEFVSDLRFQEGDGNDLMVHSIDIHMKQQEKLTILTSVEEKKKNVLKDKKVLVVDDSKMIRFLLSKELGQYGCLVSEAENGLDGFVRAQAIKPDLIIMDLIMPRMGGLEAIAKIREISPFIPVIILTSTSKKEEVMSAAALKVKGYIKKPIKMDQLLRLARSCFE